MIAVVDYGAGNLRSVANALMAVGLESVVSSDPDEIYKADAVIIPGVGSFKENMAELHGREVVEALDKMVLEDKKLCLGICLGMQFLASKGYEDGETQGLGWIPGEVKKIVPDSPEFRVPHMGWNDIEFNPDCPLFKDMPTDPPVFYFVHSFHFVPDDPADVAAFCHHGGNVTAAVWKDNIFGTQFHPEKSQENGIKLLENFASLL